MAFRRRQIGYRCHIYAPDADGPAAQVAWRFSEGAFADAEALARFARECDVVTYEFENVPTAPLAAIAAEVPLHPPVRALEIAQDRLSEKGFVAGLGGRPAPYAAVDDRAGLAAAKRPHRHAGDPQDPTLGYDGKGQGADQWTAARRTRPGARAWRALRC